MTKGYKGMLRDRLIPIWNLALLWCKVKQRWIDTVYERNLKNCPKKLRSENCKLLAGHLNRYNIRVSFLSTVDPDGFLYGEDKEEYQMWKNVNSWIEWFSKHSMFVYDAIDSYYNNGCDDDYIIKTINYPGLDEKLCKFMIKHKHIYYEQS